jgi:hypothetical protein
MAAQEEAALAEIFEEEEQEMKVPASSCLVFWRAVCLVLCLVPVGPWGWPGSPVPLPALQGLFSPLGVGIHCASLAPPVARVCAVCSACTSDRLS